ncbi:MAG: type 1 glutamine amidotransferase, partial [Ghiorsea sp.]|nr:type 1 glutamine amidotransferase [Ghiorsea sp.]
IDAGKKVLGICLGAQLIANVMGAKVYAGQHKESGWFDIVRAPELQATVLADVFSESMKAFHWHSDTFEIPKGAKALAASQACENQGFVYDNRVVGLQFHLETTPESAAALIAHCAADLDGSVYVQSAEEMLNDKQRFTDLNKVMYKVLDRLTAVKK